MTNPCPTEAEFLARQEAIADAYERHQRALSIADGGQSCPYCGELGGGVVEIEDRDDSVGYYSLETRCTRCAQPAVAAIDAVDLETDLPEVEF